MPDQLSLRALNRITLARQLLLSRSEMTPMQAITHLAGLQAQAPLAPYVGLWTRLAAFRPQPLENLLNERGVLRAHLMRNTVHLVTTADYLEFRPLFQPPMDRALAGHFGRRLAGVDLAELREAAAALLSTTPLTRGALGRALTPRWPGHDPAALAYAATHLLPLVHVPPRGLRHQSGPAAFMLASAWLEPQITPTVTSISFISIAAMTPPAPADLAAEGQRLLGFVRPADAARDVRFVRDGE